MHNEAKPIPLLLFLGERIGKGTMGGGGGGGHAEGTMGGRG